MQKANNRIEKTTRLHFVQSGCSCFTVRSFVCYSEGCLYICLFYPTGVFPCPPVGNCDEPACWESNTPLFRKKKPSVWMHIWPKENDGNEKSITRGQSTKRFPFASGNSPLKICTAS